MQRLRKNTKFILQLEIKEGKKLKEQSANIKHYIELHFIVLLFGFTAVLGKLITISAAELVVYRMGISATVLGLFCAISKINFRLPTKQIIQILSVGLIVAAHWVFFFEAVKVSNVAVTLGVMASGTLFVSFLEPIVEKRKIWWVEVFIGIVIMIGLYILTRFAMNYYLGIIYALISSFLAALFGVANRQLTQGTNPVVISFYEMAAGCVAVLVYLYGTGNSLCVLQDLLPADYLWIGILAILCTAYAFVGTVRLMKVLSTYTVSLAINLEPVYGIILAFLIFGESERMDFGFYIGAIILVVSIFVYPVLKNKGFGN